MFGSQCERCGAAKVMGTTCPQCGDSPRNIAILGTRSDSKSRETIPPLKPKLKDKGGFHV